MDLRALIRVHLRDDDEAETAEVAAREKLIAEGVRLVTHDQVEGRQLELRDAISGELIYRGELEAGLAMFDDGSLADVDTINMAVKHELTIVPGIPEGLQMAIREWVERNLEDARDYAETG